MLNSGEIAERVLAAIRRALPRKQVVLDARFEDLGIESLDAMSLIFAVEEEFDIDFDSTPSGDIRSVEDVVRAVDTLIRRKAESKA